MDSARTNVSSSAIRTKIGNLILSSMLIRTIPKVSADRFHGQLRAATATDFGSASAVSDGTTENLIAKMVLQAD